MPTPDAQPNAIQPTQTLEPELIKVLQYMFSENNKVLVKQFGLQIGVLHSALNSLSDRVDFLRDRVDSFSDILSDRVDSLTTLSARLDKLDRFVGDLNESQPYY
eukprot:CAMPEP_0202916914 /NCGR_PEP_ID=MMETSP1392-20130828/69771_1 /ASSEMBLY_ACC=CAM_ASM_000868 /TAXON_ID=225041 /ORGANISM="Chlamydomonas chlamydogama, Strain SAG 11-48b" /LENGTH=103 /DNA_ID=CAMNT_0049609493 /DNA_START=307 /DNA_END=618 /DNA_ORIENTATION=+